ncbi:MAG: IS4 family transposase [Planctomycetes bacterium]|nr:IS4 family transposase [Planctomycetota bacterium]
MARRRDTATERPAPIPIPKDQVMGRRFIRLLEGQLHHLREHANHGNRCFFYDQLVVAHLLAFFNPILAGLRKIEDVFDVPAVRKRLKMPRVPKSTLADAQRLFDPELLLPLFESLKERADIQEHDPRLDGLTNKLLAVDGSFLAVAARIAWAIYNHSAKNNVTQGNVRVHMHFDILRGVPEHATLTGGQASEAEQLRQALRSDCFYVMDRGFQPYQLLADIIGLGSDFLVRLRKSARCESIETRPLTAADRAAGVLGDTRVRVGWREAHTAVKQPLRLVQIAQPDQPDQPLRLLTNRLDLPAETIGVIYRHRWQVELFFRWLKCMANFKHFYSESPQGMTLQIYIALIGTLLIAIETGARPSSYDFALMSLAASGLAPLDQILTQAAKRRAERRRAAERQRARRAQKNSG